MKIKKTELLDTLPEFIFMNNREYYLVITKDIGNNYCVSYTEVEGRDVEVAFSTKTLISRYGKLKVIIPQIHQYFEKISTKEPGRATSGGLDETIYYNDEWQEIL